MKPSPTKLLVLFWLLIVTVCLMVSRSHGQFVPGGTPVFGTGTGSGGGSFTNWADLTNIVESVAVTSAQATNIAAYQAQKTFTNVVYHNGVGTFYPSLESAVSAALVSDYIQAAPEVHTISNALVVPVGATLDLRGATLNSYVAPLGTTGPTIIVRDNSRVLGGYVDLKLRGIPSADSSTYQAVIGSHKNVNTGTATNVWVYDNAGICETDAIFARNTNVNRINFVSCNYTSRWDVLAFMEAAHTFNFYNCALVTIGTNFISGSAGRGNCITAEANATGSKVVVSGGLLTCSNSVGRIVESFGGIKYSFHNVGITNLGTSASFILTAGDVAVFDGTSVTSGEVDDDFGNGVAIWRPGKYVGEFYGNGVGLTNVPYESVNGRLWGTNATSGKVTNILGGVSVGASQIAITNGGAVVNLGTSPGMIRALNNGVSTLIESNTITTGVIGVGVGSQSLPSLSFAGDLNTGLYNDGSNDRIKVTVGGNYIGQILSGAWEIPVAINTFTALGGNGTATIGGIGTARMNTLIVTNSVTATNGFYFPQLSGIPSTVDLRSSSGNTNWLVFNLGGDLYAIKTNAAAASSYITNKLTGLDLLSTKVAIGSAVSLTTDTAANVASLALGAGEWVVSGNVNLINGGGTTLSGSITSIGTTSATLATDGTECYRGPGVASWNYEGATVPPVKITGPATVYLVTKATFTISTCSAFGSINAEQVR